MFDRIAGLYDRMNTVMTAGLHHRWRQRAADLAGLTAGRARARRRDRDRRPGARAGRSRRPRGRGRRQRLLRADARAGASQGRGSTRRRREAAAPLRAGQRAGAPLRATASSTPPPSASARATSPTLSAGCARWPASCGPAGHVVILEITTPRRPPLSTFFRLWFDRVVPALGRLAGDAAGLQLPAELGQAVSRARGARRA